MPAPAVNVIVIRTRYASVLDLIDRFQLSAKEWRPSLSAIGRALGPFCAGVGRAEIKFFYDGFIDISTASPRPLDTRASRQHPASRLFL